MVNIIRRFQQPLMIAITVLVIIAFAWLYNDTRFIDKSGSDRIGSIYGKSVSFAQGQRAGRKFEMAMMLNLQDLLGSLAVTQELGKENFIWNNMVLKHEAEALGFEPTADEKLAAIQAIPVFQTGGAYDPNRYQAFMQYAVTPRGFTGDDLEDLIADDLRLKKLKTVLGATVAPSEPELREAFERSNQKTEVSVIRVKLADFLAAAQVPEDEVKKAYEARKGTLTSEEMRKVKFVAFVLPTTDKPLTGKDRVDALTALSKKAEDFSIAMTDKDAKFEEVAAKFGAKVEESPAFVRSAPPELFADASKVGGAAFKLTPKDPNSDVIDTERGYYLLHLAEVTAPRQLAFEEVQGKLLDELKRDRAREALDLKAKEIHNKVEADLKAGKSFADATAAAGATVENFPSFSRREPQFEPVNAGEIMDAASNLAVGQLSAVVPTEADSLLVHVDQRLPIDEEKYKTDRPRLVEGVVRYQQEVLFQEWLKNRRAAAQVKSDMRG